MYPGPAAFDASTGRSGGKKKPCKYGARGEDGHCPKKPKAARTKKPKVKKPCKFGDRMANGRCPKKAKRLETAIRRGRAGEFVKEKASRAVTKAATRGTDVAILQGLRWASKNKPAAVTALTRIGIWGAVAGAAYYLFKRLYKADGDAKLANKVAAQKAAIAALNDALAELARQNGINPVGEFGTKLPPKEVQKIYDWFATRVALINKTYDSRYERLAGIK